MTRSTALLTGARLHRRQSGVHPHPRGVLPLERARRERGDPHPHPFHSGPTGGRFDGKTAADGTCAAYFMVPAFRDGSAAAVIRVTSPIGSTEFKFPVKRSA